MLISVSVLPAHAQRNTFSRVDVSLQKSNTPTLLISVQHSVDVICLNHGKVDLDSREPLLREHKGAYLFAPWKEV